jgi:glycosyltransferase domain-containing protein
MSERYTLVIPTYNRVALLGRLVRYYRKRASSIDLLVLDSSKPDVTKENAKALASLGASVRHVIYPGDAPGGSKISQGLALVQTPYVSFCADDDLVFPEELARAVDFLDRHPDYVSGHGLYLNFRQNGNEVQLLSEYAGPSNEPAHPGARIFRLLQRYESLFYGAFRIQDLRDILSAAQALPSPHYQELFQSVATVIKGKVKRFPSFYAARQSGPPADPNREKWQTYDWFADNPEEFLEHYRAYRAELWKFYETHAPAPRLEKAAFLRVLDLAHAVFFSARCSAEHFHSVLQPYWPADGFANVGEINLLEELGAPRAFARGSLDRLMARKWLAFRALIATPALWRLDREVRRTCATPWKCRIPGSLRWLASVPQFRESYLELCNYLDAG